MQATIAGGERWKMLRRITARWDGMGRGWAMGDGAKACNILHVDDVHQNYGEVGCAVLRCTDGLRNTAREQMEGTIESVTKGLGGCAAGTVDPPKETATDRRCPPFPRDPSSARMERFASARRTCCTPGTHCPWPSRAINIPWPSPDFALADLPTSSFCTMRTFSTTTLPFAIPSTSPTSIHPPPPQSTKMAVGVSEHAIAPPTNSAIDSPAAPLASQSPFQSPSSSRSPKSNKNNQIN